MKKSFKLLSAALMALAMCVSAQANELTLFDGGAVSENIPFRATYYDWAPYLGQVIYPADALTAMVGEDISAMKFYIANENGNVMDGGKLAVYVGTTTMTSFYSSFISEDDLTKVAEISMTRGEAEVVVNFDEPWKYEGGNLAIEFTLITEGSYSDYGYFVGQAADVNCSAYGYYSVNTEAFLPKTTFTYGGDTPEPQGIRGDVNQDTNVTIGDVTALINYLLTDPTAAPMDAADCNQDHNISIADVTALINYLLTQQW